MAEQSTPHAACSKQSLDPIHHECAACPRRPLMGPRRSGVRTKAYANQTGHCGGGRLHGNCRRSGSIGSSAVTPPFESFEVQADGRFEETEQVCALESLLPCCHNCRW